MDPLCIKGDWTTDQVCELLVKAGLDTAKFKGINGEAALNLTDDGLMALGIEDPKKRRQYRNVIRNKNQPKVFPDPIHGSIELHPLLVRIIDTPQFQRLRSIEQLGGAYYVYPGARHSRFEHSIGVAHLAGELGKTLKHKQQGIISDKDILCVQIAGLCHDLGHGPFSHLFDELFLNGRIKHEEISRRMFDHLVDENGLESLMKLYDLNLFNQYTADLYNDDRNRIKDMIHSTREHNFLYEIVANKTNGVDVDKFDYFARDCHYLGLLNNFDHQRFMTFARVCTDDDGKTHICMRDKEVDSLYTMYQTRYYLHKRACQHKVKYGIDLMIKDALDAARDTNIDGLILSSINSNNIDMEFFTQLTDNVLEQIRHSTNPRLATAQNIIERIRSRDLYKCVLEQKLNSGVNPANIDTDQLKTTLMRTPNSNLTQENFEAVKITIDYGMGNQNPVNNMYYYTKNDRNRARKITGHEMSPLIPRTFSETVIRVYYKETGLIDPENIQAPFQQWCNALP